MKFYFVIVVGAMWGTMHRRFLCGFLYMIDCQRAFWEEYTDEKEKKRKVPSFEIRFSQKLKKALPRSDNCHHVRKKLFNCRSSTRFYYAQHYGMQFLKMNQNYVGHHTIKHTFFYINQHRHQSQYALVSIVKVNQYGIQRRQRTDALCPNDD